MYIFGIMPSVSPVHVSKKGTINTEIIQERIFPGVGVRVEEAQPRQ